MKNKNSIDITIVVPVFNEKDNISILCERVILACEGLNRAFEILIVDDGSIDGTYEILKGLHAQDNRIRVVRFRRNCGQTAAMAAGFEFARGEVIVSMDGDLQNDPGDIPQLLAKLNEGYDVVAGWRKDRKDKFWTRRLPSMVANRIISLVTGVLIHDNGCSLKAYRASVIKGVRLYGELHRFIPAMATLTGARTTEIVVNHYSRQFGKSKYGISRVWRVILDIVTVKMIIGFAARPALWFGLLSFPFIVVGLLVLLIAGFHYLGTFVDEWMVSSTTALLVIFLGAHLLSMGLIAELFVKTGDYRPHKSLYPTLKELKVD